MEQKMSNFRQVKDRQLQILTELKAANGKLGEIRPRLVGEREQNKGKSQMSFTVKLEYDAVMGHRVELLKQLEAVNAELEVARAEKKASISELRSKKSGDNEAKKLERQAKAAERQKQAQQKAADKAVERQQKATARDQRRAERIAELEAEGHSTVGYNIPLLNNIEEFVNATISKAFEITKETAKEINDRNRRDHIDNLVNAL
jgi:hypothetical protein